MQRNFPRVLKSSTFYTLQRDEKREREKVKRRQRKRDGEREVDRD